MRILIYSPYSLDNNSTPVMLDEALEYLRDAANDVVVVTCRGELRPCLTNAEQSVVRCTECRFSTQLLMRKARHPRLAHDTLSSFVERDEFAEIDRHVFSYRSLRDLKAIEWKGANIGLSVVSTYVSMTRNLNPAINKWNRRFLDDSLRAEARLVAMSSRMLAKYQPNLLCLFNGRFVGLRAVLEAAQQRGIRTKVLENTFSTNVETLKKVEFYDAMPHDIDKITPIIERNWETWTGGDRTRAASTFFERRRRGQTASDSVYVSNQRPDLLPSDWDHSKRQFVIFNSSEDEFFSIGKSFDKYKLFDDQLQGIRYLAECARTDPSIHFFLRVHPNMARLPYSYHTDLARLSEEFPNITVIPAESRVSTYALIDHCEKVFVFGSTAGVEAAYWGKPVILMGGALYLHLDVAYYPKALAELDELMFGALVPKPQLGALKYALFLFGERGRAYQHVNFNYKQLIIGDKRLPIPRCFEVAGSIVPYAMVIAFFRLLNGISHLTFKCITMKNLSVEARQDAVEVSGAGG